MSIAFNTIVAGIRTNTHHIEFDNSRAVQGLNIKPHKILLMGVKLSGGSVAELEPRRILSADAADGFWGVGAQLSEMAHWGKKANSQTEMWGIGIDELVGGTAGTTTATIVGTLTADGSIACYVDGRYVATAVSSGDDATAIATAVTASIVAHNDYARMPFTVASALGVITFTMKWKGVEQADVRFNYNDDDEFPAGLTSITVAEGVAGAGNPDISEIIAAMGDVQYDTIICPWTDATNLAALEAELNTRFGGMVQKEGHAFSAICDTHGNTTTLGNSRNSKHLTIIGGNQSPTASWKWAAVAGCVDAFEPDPARPRQTLPLPGLLPAARTAVWTQAERNLLLTDGIATHVVDDGGNVSIERLITTYQTNSLSVPDPSYLDVTTLRTLAALRYDRRSAIALNFPRHKLMGDADDLPAGQAIVTPNTIRAHGLAQFQRWQAAGWVEDFEQFESEYIVIRDPADVNRIQEQMGPNLMNQFRGLSGQIQFLL